LQQGIRFQRGTSSRGLQALCALITLFGMISSWFF
jgi:hypothetical protein